MSRKNGAVRVVSIPFYARTAPTRKREKDVTQPPAQPAPNDPNMNPLEASNPPPLSTPQPHPAPLPTQHRPVVVQQDMSGLAATLNEFGQRLSALPEQLVNSLKEGAAHAVPQGAPAAPQPGQQAPTPQPIPAAGQATADANLDQSGRRPGRFANWWFNGGRKP